MYFCLQDIYILCQNTLYTLHCCKISFLVHLFLNMTCNLSLFDIQHIIPYYFIDASVVRHHHHFSSTLNIYFSFCHESESIVKAKIRYPIFCMSCFSQNIISKSNTNGEGIMKTSLRPKLLGHDKYFFCFI